MRMRGLIITATFICFLFIVYIIFSFVLATFDITQWPEKQRITCVIVAAFVTGVTLAIDELI